VTTTVSSILIRLSDGTEVECPGDSLEVISVSQSEGSNKTLLIANVDVPFKLALLWDAFRASFAQKDTTDLPK
jgi:hypothetical protein